MFDLEKVSGMESDEMYDDEKKKVIMELMKKFFEMMDKDGESEGVEEAIEDPEMISDMPVAEDEELVAEDEESMPGGVEVEQEEDIPGLRDEIQEYMKKGRNGTRAPVKALSVSMMSKTPKRIKKGKKGKY